MNVTLDELLIVIGGLTVENKRLEMQVAKLTAQIQAIESAPQAVVADVPAQEP